MRKRDAVWAVVALLMFVCGWITARQMLVSALSGTSMGYVSEGQALLAKRDCDKAVAMLNKALALDEHSFVGSLSLARAYECVNNYEMAVDSYSTALALSQKSQPQGAEQSLITKKIEELQKLQKLGRSSK